MDSVSAGCYKICFETLLRPYRGMAMRLGSAAELKALTSSTLDEMILLAIDREDRIEIRKEEHARFEGEYLRTLGAIRKRLEGEKASIAENLQNDSDDAKDKQDDANCG